VKILRDRKYGEILGAHIVGAHASEMIQSWPWRARTNTRRGNRSRDSRPSHDVEAIGEAALDSMGRSCTFEQRIGQGPSPRARLSRRRRGIRRGVLDDVTIFVLSMRAYDISGYLLVAAC